MMSVVVSLSASGCVESLHASGHAGAGTRGGDIVCAAATALVRTAADVLHARPGIRCQAEAPVEGDLRLTVSEVPAESLEWARGVTDYLLEGCRRIEAEAPRSLALRILRRG